MHNKNEEITTNTIYASNILQMCERAQNNEIIIRNSSHTTIYMATNKCKWANIQEWQNGKGVTFGEEIRFAIPYNKVWNVSGFDVCAGNNQGDPLFDIPGVYIYILGINHSLQPLCTAKIKLSGLI